MAGLLDLLMPSSDGGGLLDFLKRNANAAIANTPTGAPGDQANYGMPAMPSTPAPTTIPILAPNQPSPLDNAQWPAGPVGAPSQTPIVAANQPSPLDNAQWPYGPIGAPSQANASMPMPTGAPPTAAPIAPQSSLVTMPALTGASPTSGLVSGFLNHAADALMSIPRGGAPSPAQVAQQTANLTQRMLQAHGYSPTDALTLVQPGNQAALGEALKQIQAKSYGPHPAENLGQGYIRDPLTGKVTRAYTPEDKVPVGFQQDDSGNLHFIPGGPADPAYLRQKAQQGVDPNAVHVLGNNGELYKTNPDGTVTVIHKNTSNADATLSDDATKAMAAQYLAGDRTVLQNLGRGAQGAANIVKLREEITRQAQAAGMNAQDIVTTFNEQAGNLAGQRTVGTRAANISLAANEANNMIPIALAASAKVPRGEWVPWNKMVQMYQKGTSSPELASFVAATNSLVNAYVRAVSPTGVPTDSMREHAYEMLNSAQSPEAYAAVISTMKQEMQSALSAPAQVRQELRGQANGTAKAPVKVDGYTITEH